MPEFYCTHCGQHIEADEELAGTPDNCPACQGAITVPILAAPIRPATPFSIPLPAPGEKLVPKGGGRALVSVIAVLTLLGLAGGVWWLSHPSRKSSPQATSDASGENSAPTLPTSEELFAQGKLAYDAKNFEEALAKFSAAAERGHAKAQFNLGGLFYKGEGVAKDLAEAARWYRKASEQGHAEAQFTLGIMYLFGDGVPNDSTEAVHWYRRAADQGHLGAQFNLAGMYENGMGVAKDLAEAVRWYRKAAEQEDAEAQFKLASMHENGEGVAKDLAEAARWYRKAAEQGHVLAQFNLGFMYDNGNGVVKNFTEALHWYRKAADQKFVVAQFNLGFMYYNGEGVAKNFTEAVGWWRKAAEQEHAGAQNNLGFMYANGNGVAQDFAEALQWYRKAAEQENAYAQCSLGSMYGNGEGVVKDLAEAARWFRKAADQGNAGAQHNLGRMYYNGEGVAKDFAEAVRWYRKAAEQEDAEAQFKLGLMYAKGEGVAKDPAEAVRWYRMAAEQGFAGAQFNLGWMYYNGEGIAKDFAEAARWYRKAAEQGHSSAQMNLALMFYNGEGVAKNLAFAYKWILLAKAGDSKASLDELVSYLERGMSPSQREQGQALAAAFVPKPENPQDLETGERGLSTMEREGLIAQKPEMRHGRGWREYGENPQPGHPQYFGGTGFFIAGDGKLVTAAHVVAKAKHILVVLPDGRKFAARVLREDAKLDLAVLQAEVTGNPPPALAITSSRALSLGQPVMTIGFPNTEVQGQEPKFTDGKISALTGLADDPSTLQISVPVQPGNSGGALVDMSGRVVGVVSSRLDAIAMAKKTGALSENVNYAVKSSQLLALLEGTATDLPEAPQETPPTTADPKTIQKVKDATVLILVEAE